MKSTEIKTIFNKKYNGNKNIMTPYILAYWSRNNLIAELSTGIGLSDSEIYGLTVLTITGETTDYSGCFDSKKEAQEHWRSI